MARDRNILCVHYVRAGVCDLGKERIRRAGIKIKEENRWN